MGDHVDGNRPGGLDLDVRFTFRKLHIRIRRPVPVEDLPYRLSREPQTDPGAIDFRLSTGVIVDLNDNVSVPGKRSTDAILQDARPAAGSPSPQVALHINART